MQSSNKKPRLSQASVRFGSRVEVDIPVRLKASGRTEHPGSVRNASISGALIATEFDLPLDARLLVVVSVAEHDREVSHELGARVIRLDAIGLGVEWCDNGGIDVIDLLERAADSRPTGTRK